MAYGCSTDFDVTADYEEVMVVIGLLDPSADVQYIRIERGFLDRETSAVEQSKIADSIYYPLGTLIVTLKSLDSDFEVDLSDSIVQIPKDSGGFAFSTNPIYAFSIDLDEEEDYMLEVTNTITGKKITAQTPIIEEFQLARPPGNQNIAYDVNLASVDLNGNPRPTQVQWAGAKDGKVYELDLRFHYIEYRNGINAPGDTLFIDWPVFRNFTSSGTEGLQTLQYPMIGNGFYPFLARELESSSSIARRPLDEPISFVFRVGGQSLWDYIQVNTQGQTGITALEAQTAFTNIEDGLGIFSTRVTKIRANVALADQALDSLACGQFTADLNFSVNQPVSCD